MKAQLVGKPLDQSLVELKKCQILFALRHSPKQVLALKPIQDEVIGNDVNQLVEFAVALTRLEESHDIAIELVGTKMFIKLASTDAGPLGSTSRTVAGQNFDSPSSQERRPLFQPMHPPSMAAALSGTVKGRQVPDAVNENGRGESNDFSILHRPHIVRKKEEVHVELCHKCERMASGHCECGLPVCSAHRYSSDGERNPYGMCGKCQKEITSDVEVFNSCGRQV